MNKKILLLVLILSYINSKAQFDHQNINYLGSFHDSTVVAEHVYGIKYQACIGWVDTSDGKEYGIIGSTAGTYIIDVTDPTNPIQKDYIPHRQNDCIWHEYKTYHNYLYIISDDDSVNSLQIADLSYLPDSAHVVYDSTDIFVHAHTLFIERDLLYVGIVTTTTGVSSMNVYSLSDPTHPTLLRRLDEDNTDVNYVHDMYVKNDTVYASCGYEGLFIFRYDTAANQFLLLGTLQDPTLPHPYNHSSVLSPDHNTLFVCEEVPDGQPLKIVNVSNIHNPSLVDTFYSNFGATPHNPEVKDDMLIIAYYQDGVYIYDISNPLAPYKIAYFDTYPTNTGGTYLPNAYAGCWSTYSELPSGILLASDMQLGLFCLDISGVTASVSSIKKNHVSIYPNPAKDNITIIGAGNSTLELCDLSGKKYKSTKVTEDNYIIDVSTLSNGLYVLRLISNESVVSKKIVVE